MRVFPQNYDYSCTAAVMQAAFHALTGFEIEHDFAVRLTGCKPHGAQLSKIATALQKRCRITPRRLARLAAVRRALKVGQMVISSDCTSWGGRHAILIVGATPKGFYVADSNLPDGVRWRSEAFVRRATDEFIAIEPKDIAPPRRSSL